MDMTGRASTPGAAAVIQGNLRDRPKDVLANRLERDGYVRSHWEAERTANREGRPARGYYELTAAGVKALDGALQTLRHLAAFRGRMDPA